MGESKHRPRSPQALRKVYPRLYADLNFLIEALEAGEEYRAALIELAVGHVEFVFSLWHIAEFTKVRNPNQVVDLVLKMRPTYLHDRTVILRRIVKDRVNQIYGIPLTRWEPADTLNSVVAAMIHPRALDRAISLREVVSNTDPAPVRAAYNANKHAHDFLISSYKRESALAQGQAGIEDAFLLKFLPQTVSYGRIVGPLHHSTKIELIKQIRFPTIPLVAVEAALTEDGHRPGHKLREQDFLDRLHLANALLYVDYFVSSDRKLAKLVERIRETLPFPIAEVVSREEFSHRFLGRC